ncbi:MAG: M3 family metallopeptidase [Schleiferiaceae bacterium]|nr:M3 family metallopeptidase [Schleiferiaceae bacterium]
MSSNNNPLIQSFNTPFQTPPFDLIKEEHYLPAFKQGITEGKAEVEKIANSTEAPNFENTLDALENCGELVNRVSEIFFNINSAETNDEIQKIAQEASPLLTEYSNDILLNEKLFERIKYVWENEDQSKLNTEQRRLLEKTYKSFTRNGALLDTEKKEELRAINKELSVLSLKFGENVLAETNKYELIIENEEDLEGLPDFAKEAAAATAKEKDKEGTWVFTLDAPSYIPFVTYAKNRELRKELASAFGSRAFKGDEFDNQENVKNIATLRFKRAQILGYDSHAHFILEERMAETPDKVSSFLNDLLQHAKPAADQDMNDVKEFALKDGISDFQRWDLSYYSEKLKKELFNIDDELLKPYFKLENVVEGAFKVAEKLYGITFTERTDIPLYHEDVTTYEVKNEDGSLVSIFYADFFPRSGKRNGAWMTSYRSQKIKNGENIRPLVSIVCNFTKPTPTKPSLLTFNEVTTLFHEFGHALHGMLANTTYAGLSGTSVYWDFVELPSQIMENWCFEKECLDLFARHYETGEAIPEEYIKRIKDSATFQEGYMTNRQLSFGMLDMAWHGGNPLAIEDVSQFENEAMAPTQVLPNIEGTNMSCAFSHIFQGGYSAGYYSYKWAEVLDADAFELFKEKGLFDKQTATKFRKLLSSGGTHHPMELYKEFRGREPKVEALLKRAGLIKA